MAAKGAVRLVDDVTPSERISGDDLATMREYRTQEQCAQAEYVIAQRVTASFAAILSNRYSLKPGDSVDDSGVIVRGEGGPEA